ncbi:3-deoxy-7-phosphoheptulonate synthase [Crossiella sp. CA-258035]|uniref:3-deoxy-7-phosphoheptulonate synthase n=1 Tax=Crossiella sp. CA-258035 TaxID=2981138 RepID=UPI0024BCDB08|nr:3-deoxy-7-phosphoheptulonate synthase [Crossiella sp. CA-258035]WHT20502.1 3-deoxy-7-phosphoheptulonate synthase [Crossiella sp. CA-258035]
MHTEAVRDALADEELAYWQLLPARQQPSWTDPALAAAHRAELAARPGLVHWAEVDGLHRWLAEVAGGSAKVVQAGDCAEDPAECTPEHIARKVAMLDALAGVVGGASGLPVARVGRFAGQFAKPRSKPSERCGDLELPSYRGHLVNGPEADLTARRPDSARLVSCYEAASVAVGALRGARRPFGQPVWTSHEALVLDYELPLLRKNSAGQTFLASTHWPWIGDRTRQPDGAHVRLLASVANPVACKVGPTTPRADLLKLCEVLDPHRTPGRLTLIARFGVRRAAELAPLVAAVRAAGHPVVWLSDPMHGNTISAAGGVKTRLLADLIAEVSQFLRIVPEQGGVAGGLHLEATPDPVTECLGAGVEADDLARCYTSLCDPRLNQQQAITLAAAWR